MMRGLKIVLLLICCCNYSFSQQTTLPFWNDIQAFKKQDSINPPAQNQILLIGSSSFTLWKDVQDYFPAYPIINRGFGGSSLPDVIRYANDIIFTYQPKQILIYCGENDLVGDSTVTGKIVFKRFKNLYNAIRKIMPAVPVAYISMKPSPSRWHLRQKMITGNRLIERFLKRKNAVFINVWPAMLAPGGEPMSDIFKADRLHMNDKGYAIWQKLIAPYLKN